MRSPLLVPTFARLTDFCGLWAMESAAFAAMWRTASHTDLAAHMRAGPPKVVSTADLVPARNGKSVAVVKAVGTLMKGQSSFGGTSTVQLRRDIRSAANDPNVSGILLAIDSPGGTVAGTADLGAEVKSARRKKPVWAHVDDMAASAAYWVASQADAIYANGPTALVGSIGTVWNVYDSSAAAEREGVKVLQFATGPLKGAGSPGTVITDEQQAEFRKLVGEMQTHFDSAVRSGRGMSAAQLHAVRSGGVFPAAEAKDLKLIDGVRSLETTLAALAEAK
jgi:signal peptide peptidase SppA